MKFIFFAISLVPFTIQAQNEKITTGQQAVAMLAALSRFDFTDEGEFAGNKVPDTLYHNDTTIKAIGYFALDKENKKSAYKIGLWKEFYVNGTIKSVGNYGIQYLLISYSSNKSVIYNEYRTGEWIFYYDNAQVKAKGKYRLKKKLLSTGVEGQIARSPVTTQEWVFLDRQGKKLIDKREVIGELE